MLASFPVWHDNRHRLWSRLGKSHEGLLLDVERRADLIGIQEAIPAWRKISR